MKSTSVHTSLLPDDYNLHNTVEQLQQSTPKITCRGWDAVVLDTLLTGAQAADFMLARSQAL